MCCHVCIEEWKTTLKLFDCCMISDTVLLSGSFREECVCVQSQWWEGLIVLH